jgi:hypothetical protein
VEAGEYKQFGLSIMNFEIEKVVQIENLRSKV